MKTFPPQLCGPLQTLCALCVLFSLVFSAPSAPPPPNILLIIADDMGYSDLGCYGGEIDTPNLDALSANGLRFTNFYVNNMCWPTRASLLTSLYPKTALPRNGSAEGGLHPDALTLPQALRDAGYRTFMSGKWHLSDPNDLDGPNAPHHRGFDHYYGILNGAASFYAPFSLTRDGKDASADFDIKTNPGYHFTDAISDEAITMLRDGQIEDRQSTIEHPFFLYLAYTAAHWPLHATPEDIAHYKGKFSAGWDTLREERHARMIDMGLVDPEWKLSPRHPGVPAWDDTEDKEWQQRRMEVYAAQITAMDRGIGRILDHLRATGQYDNTLILYQHDNGACHVEYGENRTGNYLPKNTRDGKPMRPGNIPGLMPGPEDTYQSYGYGWANLGNTPFRLFKQHDHEGGTKSPLIVSWPAGIPHDIQGGLVHDVTHVIDIMPTLLAAAGNQPTEGNAPSLPKLRLPLEGHSFFPLLAARPSAIDSFRPLFWQHAKGAAVRAGKWKLVRENKSPWELYDLERDGTELNDLAQKLPEKVAEFEKLHADWAVRTDLGAKSKKKK